MTRLQVGWLTVEHTSAYSRCLEHGKTSGTIPVPIFADQIPEGYSLVCSSEECQEVIYGSGPPILYRYDTRQLYGEVARITGEEAEIAKEILGEFCEANRTIFNYDSY